MHDHAAFGLTIRSEFALPHLPPGQAGNDIVQIRRRPVDSPSADMISHRNWHASPERFVIRIGDRCIMSVSGGNTIDIDSAEHVDAELLPSMILGSGFAALLMQRRILPLHASAVDTPTGALVIMGRSGAGKSTLLAGLLAHGFAMISDDVLGLVAQQQGAPLALPSFPVARLWRDSLEKLGQPLQGLVRVRPPLEKYYVPTDRFVPGPRPIAGIVHLTEGNADRPAFREIAPHRRLECLSRFVFRKQFVRGMQLQRFAFETGAAVARLVPFHRLSRPSDNIAPVEFAGCLLEQLPYLRTDTDCDAPA